MGGLFIEEKKVRRFWVDPESVKGPLVDVTGESFNHMVKVCRLGEGDRAELLNGGDQALCVKILEVTKKRLTAEIESTRPLPVPEKPFLHLALCWPKLNTFEAVLEKSVELGVYSVQPLFNDFSFIKNAGEPRLKKSDRWRKIVTSATEQTGRGQLMGLQESQKLSDFLRDFNHSSTELCLMFYEGESLPSAREFLSSQLSSEVENIWVLVGSEGGFSQEEVSLAQSKGIPVLSLGSQILRVETACVSILSILKYHFQGI